MAKYKAYPEYKDSGVEWLGVIPKGWTISKVKYLAPFQVGWTPPTKNDANFIGDNLWVNISDLRDKFISSTAKCISDKAAKEASMDITPRGSLLYSFKLSVGAVSFAGCDLYTNEAIASFLDRAQLPLSYLYYALPIFIIENASTNIYGAKILNQELIKNSFLLAPLHSEAEKVANFLDHETAKIDNLIEKQRQLIELLKEKRQAVISHAVTKGLNPDVPMKDSGVEWLGEVPEHWVPIQLGKVCYQVSDGPHFSPNYVDSGVLFISARNIKVNGWSLDDAKYITEKDYNEFSKRVIPEIGDVLYTKGGTTGIARTVDIEDKFQVWVHVAVLKILKDKAVPDFIAYSLNGTSCYAQSQLYTQGATNNDLGLTRLIKIWLALPPKNEQQEIVDALNSITKKYDVVTDNAMTAITILQERRTALISAAVTGKIDVRDWVAPDKQDVEESQEATA
ncbi:restriction endonuclease subunit S [Kluyvera sp. SCKS090646]|uniref:Restriction endonuclease subunit S n=1 Tax=Kluyvera sichuanensis TaxID=2725494 RepID=A0ABR6RSU1_9ENTR|nr:restriction endonuclease subunit S [Kluyvera sichuanensis]MBC1186204.1 restriction endonuclease subunit S [Kluyvera sichuanensis]